jgi:hypothetical protein
MESTSMIPLAWPHPNKAKSMPSLARKHAAAFQHDRTVGEETWLTPKFLIDAFDMSHLADVDPCSTSVRPWPTAKRHITRAEDGLALPWDPQHFYFVNPPYGTACATWLAKAAEHGNNLTLIFARTETRMFHASVWRHPNATALLFFEGRLRFARLDGSEAGSAGAPSVMLAYGGKARDELMRVSKLGLVRGQLLLLDDGSARTCRRGANTETTSRTPSPRRTASGRERPSRQRRRSSIPS